MKELFHCAPCLLKYHNMVQNVCGKEHGVLTGEIAQGIRMRATLQKHSATPSLVTITENHWTAGILVGGIRLPPPPQ